MHRLGFVLFLVLFASISIVAPFPSLAQDIDELANTPTAGAVSSSSSEALTTPAAAPAPANGPPALGPFGQWMQGILGVSERFLAALESLLEQLARVFGITIRFPHPTSPGIPTTPGGQIASGSHPAAPANRPGAPATGTASTVASAPMTPGSIAPAAGFPSRPADAEGGRAFIERTRRMTRPQREEAIFQELSRGNMPDFLRQWKTINATWTDRTGRTHTIRYQVLPDYLAIGSNEDFLRIPMSPETAQRLADQFGCILPSRKMVNDIYQQATLKLTPQPQPPGPQMMSNDYYQRHQDMIERQRAGRGTGDLIAGHKKDVCITNMLDRELQRGKHQVAIYGWHQANGKAIQPLSTIHEASYADYSHGIRMVNRTVNVDGVDMPIDQVLADPQLSHLLSDEGPIHNTRACR